MFGQYKNRDKSPVRGEGSGGPGGGGGSSASVTVITDPSTRVADSALVEELLYEFPVPAGMMLAQGTLLSFSFGFTWGAAVPGQMIFKIRRNIPPPSQLGDLLWNGTIETIDTSGFMGNPGGAQHKSIILNPGGGIGVIRPVTGFIFYYEGNPATNAGAITVDNNQSSLNSVDVAAATTWYVTGQLGTLDAGAQILGTGGTLEIIRPAILSA